MWHVLKQLFKLYFSDILNLKKKAIKYLFIFATLRAENKLKLPLKNENTFFNCQK